MATRVYLVPTDFSECSEAALAKAVELAAGTASTVVLLHVYTLVLVGPYDGALVPNGDVIASIETAAKRGLADLQKRYGNSGVEVTTSLRNGDPRDIILQVARDVAADMIVMGTHGRHGLLRALLGSTTERIVRTSDIPVLTVHAA